LKDEVQGKAYMFKCCRFNRHDSNILFTWINESIRGPGYLAAWDVGKGQVIQLKQMSKDAISQGEISQFGKFLAVGTQSGAVQIVSSLDFKVTTSRTLHQ
jgi:hypothetical protein